MSILLVGWIAGTFSGGRHGRSPGKLAPVVYGGPVARDGAMTCTTEGLNVSRGLWVCTGWTIVQSGQRIERASDAAGACGLRHVDQGLHAWVCDSADPPSQNTLPPVDQPPPASGERIAAHAQQAASTRPAA